MFPKNVATKLYADPVYKVAQKVSHFRVIIKLFETYRLDVLIRLDVFHQICFIK